MSARGDSVGNGNGVTHGDTHRDAHAYDFWSDEYVRDSDDRMFENGPMEQLAADGQLMAYHHQGFWQCMDTLREKKILEDLWQSGNAPWTGAQD